MNIYSFTVWITLFWNVSDLTLNWAGKQCLLVWFYLGLGDSCNEFLKIVTFRAFLWLGIPYGQNFRFYSTIFWSSLIFISSIPQSKNNTTPTKGFSYKRLNESFQTWQETKKRTSNVWRQSHIMVVYSMCRHNMSFFWINRWRRPISN